MCSAQVSLLSLLWINYHYYGLTDSVSDRFFEMCSEQLILALPIINSSHLRRLPFLLLLLLVLEAGVEGGEHADVGVHRGSAGDVVVVASCGHELERRLHLARAGAGPGAGAERPGGLHTQGAAGGAVGRRNGPHCHGWWRHAGLVLLALPAAAVVGFCGAAASLNRSSAPSL